MTTKKSIRKISEKIKFSTKLREKFRDLKNYWLVLSERFRYWAEAKVPLKIIRGM